MDLTKKTLLIALPVLLAALFLSNAPSVGLTPTPVYGYKIVHTYPHDRDAFTQGLLFDDGFLYEGTGLRGRSSLRKIELETGNVLRIYHLPRRFFGEGLTLWQDKLIQLTWHSGTGFVYDKEDFRLLKTFSYSGEGWGITHDGKALIVSDGTATLRFLDPRTFEEISRVQVRDGQIPIAKLNELEYVRGEIYANVYLTDRIVRISPTTGTVVGWIDLQGLLDRNELSRGAGVLNGIAYDAEGNRLLVTGKRWPKLFEIKLVSGDPRPPEQDDL